jgi:hypothetical protein
MRVLMQTFTVAIHCDEPGETDALDGADEILSRLNLPDVLADSARQALAEALANAPSAARLNWEVEAYPSD